MYRYALRTLETDLPQLLMNAAVLGAIEVGPGNTVKPINGTTWDPIGYKKVGPPPAPGEPDTRIDLALNGVKYIHINAVTQFDITVRANELAAGNPDIAAGLADFAKFFIIKIVDGRPVIAWPDNPMRGFL